MKLLSDYHTIAMLFPDAIKVLDSHQTEHHPLSVQLCAAETLPSGGMQPCRSGKARRRGGPAESWAEGGRPTEPGAGGGLEGSCTGTTPST